MVVLLLVVASLATYLFVDRAASEELPACERFTVQARERAETVTGSGHSVVVIGDSWSVGMGLEDLSRSWPRYLDGEVRVAGFSGSGFTDDASPCTAVSYAERVPAAVAGHPDLVVLEGGLNDVDQTDTAVRAGVRAALRAVRRNAPGARVVMVGPASAPARIAKVPRIDRLLREEAARAGVQYVTTAVLDLSYLAGGLHPTAEGHAVFGNTVARAISPG